MLLSCQVFAQNPWLDADILHSFMELNPDRNRVEINNAVAPDEDVILTTIEKYCPNNVTQEGGMVFLDLEECFKGNPFISFNSYAQQGFRMEYDASLEYIPEFPRSNGVSTAPGGNFITNVADGLAKFLVARTKEELNAAFFSRLQLKLEEEPAFQTLYPTTSHLFSVIGNEIYNYNAYLEAMRKGFIQDMKTLPLHVRDYSKERGFIKKEENRILLEDLLGATQYLVDGQSPVELLDFFANSASIQESGRRDSIQSEKTRAAMQDIAIGLKTLDIFSNSLRVRSEVQTWVSANELADSLQNLTYAYLYLGLLYQQSGGVRYSDNVSLQQILTKLHGATELPVSFRNYLRNLTQTGGMLDQSLYTLKNSNEYDDYYRFATQVFGFIGLISDFRKEVKMPEWKIESGVPKVISLPNLKPTRLDTIENKFLVILRQVFELEFNVRQNYYTSAVNNLASIMTQVLGDDFKYKRDFLKYSNFMASVAEARNSNEVAAAIDLFALPPGSSRLKKQSPFSVSLNSYGGIGFGWENDVRSEVNAALKQKEVLAISAPLGIDVNKGFQNGGSLSLYTQLIDVGAIYAFRFSDQTSNIPDFKFQNIFAPGLYLIYGFWGNIPVSVGLGAQLGPALRKIDPSAGLSVDETNAWRFGATLSVDIPITHFYTK